MKFSFTLLAVMLLLLLKASAQNYTVVTKLNQAYEPLNKVSTVTSTWDHNFFVTQDLGITYHWFNKVYNFDGNDGLFIFGSGILAGATNTDSTDFDIDGFFVGLKAKNNTSGLVYQIEGSQGNRIIKAEWKNATIDGGDTADYVNFQIWLYEANGAMEVHFGPSFIKNPHDFNIGNGGSNFTGPPVGVYISSIKPKDNGKVLQSIYLSGDPDNPTIVKTGLASLKSMPKNGTVYTFTDKNATDVNETAPIPSQLKIYPDPAKDYVSLEYNGCGQPASISIEDLTGRCLKSIQCGNVSSNQSIQFSTADMKPGLYLVKLQNGVNTTIQKLMVAR
jgi:hypothetical protein